MLYVIIHIKNLIFILKYVMLEFRELSGNTKFVLRLK